MPKKAPIARFVSDMPLRKQTGIETDCPEEAPGIHPALAAQGLGQIEDIQQRLFALRMHLSLVIEAVKNGDSYKAGMDLRIIEALVFDMIQLTRDISPEQGTDDQDEILVPVPSAGRVKRN